MIRLLIQIGGCLLLPVILLAIAKLAGTEWAIAVATGVILAALSFAFPDDDQ